MDELNKVVWLLLPGMMLYVHVGLASQHVLNTSMSGNLTAQLNVTTDSDDVNGNAGLYSGGMMIVDLGIDITDNISGLVVQFSFPSDIFLTNDISAIFTEESASNQSRFRDPLSSITVITPTSVRFNLNDVLLLTGENKFVLSWNVTLTNVFSEQYNTFDCSVQFFDNSHSTTPFLTLPLVITYLGANLKTELQSFTPVGPTEAGDNLQLQFFISPQTPTDPAHNLQVVVSVGSVSITSVRYSLDNSLNQTYDLALFSSSGLQVAVVNPTDNLNIVIEGVVKETVLLGHFIPVQVNLKYFDANRTDVQIMKTLEFTQILTKSPVVTVTSSNLRSVLIYTYPVTMTISIFIDKGRLSRTSLFLEVQTSALNDLALDLSIIEINTPSQITRNIRRKRSVSGAVNLGDFYNPSTNPANTPITVTVSFSVSSVGPQTNSPAIVLGQFRSDTFPSGISFLSSTVNLVESLTLTKTVQSIGGSHQQVLFEVIVNQPVSTNTAVYNLQLTDTSLPGMQANPSDKWFYRTAPSSATLSITNNNKNFKYTVPVLPAGNNVTLRYSAKIDDDDDDDGYEFDEDLELVYYEAKVIFYTYDNGGSPYPANQAIELKSYSCLRRIYMIETNIFYQQGFAALSFFIAIIVGALVAILVIFLLKKVCKKNIIGSTEPESAVDDMVKDKGNRLLMGSSPMRKGGHTITDLSMVGVNDSIVAILALKDKLQMYREIDNLDIVNTITVDTELESERNTAMSDASTMLVRGLRINGDITKDVEDKCVGNFQTQARQLEKKLNEEYSLDANIIYKDISMKNKNKLSELINRQCEEKRRVVEDITAMEEKDRRELLDMMEQQYESERNEVTYKLKLEQDELTEKLRKEFAVRKRMGLKELQQQLLEDTITQGKLAEQQADWLMKEHQKNQSAIDKLYDEEISRQRMRLEEKLARRRALAQASDLQEDDESDVLNTMAGHQLETVKDMKKRRLISAAESAEYIEKLQRDMLNLKASMDAERSKQEKDLHNRMSALKAKKLSELTKQQEHELSTFNKKSQEQQTDGPIDPISFIEARQGKMSELRKERDDLENDLDTEHAAELEKLRKKVSHDMECQMQTFEDKTLDELKNQHGVTEDQVRKILKQHEKDITRLKTSQDAEREKQRQRLAEKVQKNREQAAQRQEEERHEQQQLREHETNLVQKLLNNQMSMSEEERDKVLKEHEKQMVKLENSLTLNKLRQKKMLEDKLAERRNRSLEKLDMKHDREYQKLKRTQENNGEESDEDGMKVQLAMLKRHTEQKLSVIQSQRMDIEQELDGIRVDMMKDRAIALKDQEERLGAMVATLQMEKARELAKIEQQQKAINNLKVNLMDDLTDRGVLSNPECQRVIDIHRQEEDTLQKRLDSQRVKQEKVLRQRLEHRLQQREQLIGKIQEKEMETASKSLKNKTSFKVKKMLMMTKNMVESEKFRNQMERERDQTLESLRQQYDVIKLKAMQEQELKFISGLIRLGRFKKSELANVVKLLFPGRPPAETDRLLQIMCEHAELNKVDDDKDDASLMGETANSRLEERIKATALTSTMNSTTTPQRTGRKGSQATSMRRQSSKLKLRQLEDDMEKEEYDSGPSLRGIRRPEPLGQDDDYVEASISYNDETFLDRRRLPAPRNLDPIEVKPKRKKKKSALKKLADKNLHRVDNYDDEYSV